MFWLSRCAKLVIYNQFCERTNYWLNVIFNDTDFVLYHLFNNITFPRMSLYSIANKCNKIRRKINQNEICFRLKNRLNISTILLLFFSCCFRFVDYFIIIWFYKIQHYVQKNPKYPINYNPKSLIINNKTE